MALADLIERTGASIELGMVEDVYSKFAGGREDVSPAELSRLMRGAAAGLCRRGVVAGATARTNSRTNTFVRAEVSRSSRHESTGSTLSSPPGLALGSHEVRSVLVHEAKAESPRVCVRVSRVANRGHGPR